MRKHLGSVLSALTLVLLLAALGLLGRAWWDSRVPGTYSVMDYGEVDAGGGPAHAHGSGSGSVSVTDLRGPEGTPDARFTLTARSARVELPGGGTIDALTFDGRTPGPELRVRQGDLVEVTLRNADIDSGITIHWHGVDVPNAEDGVAGVTQDAVRPGQEYTYRFRANQVGTFWYHTHQASSDEVRRGLFGVLVIQPAEAPAPGSLDIAVLSHLFSSTPTLNGVVGTHRRAVDPGTPVRLRLVNTDSAPERFTLAGTPYRVAAIDGTELNRPTPLDATPLVLAAGGRYDLTFEMPSGAVALRGPGESELVLSPGGTGPAPAAGDEGLPAFDPLTYGAPAPTPFDADSTFDREFRLEITRKIGFFDGRPGRHWAINDRIYPDVPTFSVAEGDLVKVTVSNRSGSVHPMHLHGHHLLVLSRNGVEAGGSPWWTDTLDVESGDSFEVAFRANNPGVWMDHCHNLTHAAKGLTMHVAYAGVTTPFEIGGEHHNLPE